MSRAARATDDNGSRRREARAMRLLIALCAALITASPVAARTLTSLALDGGGHVVVPNNPQLNATQAITIEAWVRPTSIAGAMTVYGKDFVSGHWLGVSSTGRLRFYPYGITSSIDGSGALASGQWSHVAVSYDAATGRRVYYINGNVDLDVTEPPQPMPISAADAGIGAEADGSYPFVGQISELRLWSRVRSQTEIRKDMWKSLGSISDHTLRAVWPLDGSALEVRNYSNGSTVGSAFFGAQPALPTGSEPARLRRLVAPPVVDGLCDDSTYGGAQELPIWFDGDSSGGESPGFVLVGATANDLYICLGPRPAPPSGQMDVLLDTGANGGFSPDSDDYYFLVDMAGNAEAFVGGSGWMSTTTPDYQAAHGLPTEFEHSYEFRIDRSLFIHPDGLFGLRIRERHEQADGFVVPFGWPDDSVSNAPDDYVLAMIDDSTQLSDSRTPRILSVRTSPAEPRGSEPVSITTRVTDDVDLQQVEIWLDGALDTTCDLLGLSDTEVTCTAPARTMSLGPHTTRVRAVDRAGRVQWSLLQPFRIDLDGDPPELTIRHSPRNPTPGSTFSMTATAKDAAGISQIVIGPIFGATPEICNFTGSNTTEQCTKTVTAPPAVSIVRYQGTALDSESLATSRSRIALVGDGGADMDGDGIGNRHESLLCTNRSNPDTDGDALVDGWEISGVPTAGGGGVLLDLASLGANPCHKDVYLQFDYERGANVEPGVLDAVVQAYRDNAVNLHVDSNERPRLGGVEHSVVGTREAPYQTAENGGDYWFAPERLWTHYYAVSGHTIGNSLGGDGSFTYQIYLAGTGTCTGGANDGSQCARDSMCPGGTCSGVCRCPLDADPDTCRDGEFNCFREGADGQARRFMHELGHAVGLGHGGRDEIGRLPTRVGEYLYYGDGGSSGAGVNTNRKPNYLSLMNYSVNGANQCWVPATPATPTSPATSGFLVTSLDYSSSNSLGSFAESSLNESTNPITSNLAARGCPDAQPGAFPVVTYTCMDPQEAGLGTDAGLRYLMVSDGTSTIARTPMLGTLDEAPPTHAPGIDFDCDGVISTSTFGNLNGDGLFFGTPRDVCDGADGERGCDWSNVAETMSDHDDWATIPSPPTCRIPYDTTNDCYPWPAAYRAAAGSHAPDCRPAGDPDGVCSGIQTYSSGPLVLEEPYQLTVVPPGSETCDGWDNDADGTIDEGCLDSDGDGTTNRVDNCPETPNPDQRDQDRDNLGDACDAPAVVSPAFAYTGDDGTGIAWTAAADRLGYNVYCEFPDRGGRPVYVGDQHPSTTTGDFLIPPTPGNAGEYTCHVATVDLRGEEGPWSAVLVQTDHDGDAISDDEDNCLDLENGDQADEDLDGAGDACDAFPTDASEQLDTDGDGKGNNADLDDDGDGLPDTWEIAYYHDPLDPDDASSDNDQDGLDATDEFQAGTDPNVAEAANVPAIGEWGIVALCMGLVMIGAMAVRARTPDTTLPRR